MKKEWYHFNLGFAFTPFYFSRTHSFMPDLNLLFPQARDIMAAQSKFGEKWVLLGNIDRKILTVITTWKKTIFLSFKYFWNFDPPCKDGYARFTFFWLMLLILKLIICNSSFPLKVTCAFVVQENIYIKYRKRQYLPNCWSDINLVGGKVPKCITTTKDAITIVYFILIDKNIA